VWYVINSSLFDLTILIFGGAQTMMAPILLNIFFSNTPSKDYKQFHGYTKPKILQICLFGYLDMQHDDEKILG
jgi:hypothetical protein